jgi:adenine-specific DNA-methyltransferase
MAKASKPAGKRKDIVALKHDEASRKNIPPAELQSTAELLEAQDPQPPARYRRTRPLPSGERRARDTDLDPQIIWNGARITLTEKQREQLQATGEVEIGHAQLVWRGKDEQDWSDLVVQPPQLFVQEKVHPKAIIDDLKRHAGARRNGEGDDAPDLFADFNGLDPEARTEFYQHDAHWTNRMILGDSLQVMASLAEREALRGKVQCIYFDPPYGIKFNSNWQVSTQSRDVKDGKQTDISREPEQVKAFRDTWKDGIHSYLTYLRDRLTVARELLTESGSIFVQISDENVHRIRTILDEVFGENNFAALITFRKKMMPLGSDVTEGVSDYLLWYSRDRSRIKSRPLFYYKLTDGEAGWSHAMLPDGRRHTMAPAERDDHSSLPSNAAVYQPISLLPAQYRKNQDFPVLFEGRIWPPPKANSWKTDKRGMSQLLRANRLHPSGSTLRYILRHDDYPVGRITNLWADASGATQQTYVVQTNIDVVKRCILMATDPGDLVLDPTCGSGTTAFVAEQWGRRWITIDTSRVALALARTRLMSARYPYYLLADSPEGRRKEQEVSGKPQPLSATYGDIRQGFVYERAPHVTLKSIANNAEIDIIYERWQAVLEPLRAALNATHGGKPFKDWEIPREAGASWPAAAKDMLAKWWEGRIARQREIDASIAKAANVELLYDRPYGGSGGGAALLRRRGRAEASAACRARRRSLWPSRCPAPVPHGREHRRTARCARCVLGALGGLPAPIAARLRRTRLRRPSAGRRLGRHRQDGGGIASRRAAAARRSSREGAAHDVLTAARRRATTQSQRVGRP